MSNLYQHVPVRSQMETRTAKNAGKKELLQIEFSHQVVQIRIS